MLTGMTNEQSSVIPTSQQVLRTRIYSNAIYGVLDLSVGATVVYRLPYQCTLFYEPGVVVINVVVGSTDIVGSTVGVVVGCVVVCSVVVAIVVVVSIVVVVATALRSTRYAISHKMYSITVIKFWRNPANSYVMAEN